MKRKILYTSLSFLLPLSILLVVFKINGLFDDKTIISGDMFDQYYPLFNYLKDILDGKSSIFYSFNKGLGGTMFGTFFYYLSSPLNLLLIFINKTNIPEFMTYLTILKLSICGLTMYIYLSHKFKKNDVVVLAFSLCYALMGYNLNYFINIMWLDVVFLTPLVLLGIDRIIDNKSSYLYIITLFLSILSNYYISFMLCIFCIIYFIYEISLKKKTKKEKLTVSKKFIVLSVLTGLMCSFFLIPCILEMTTYGRNIKLDEILTFDYNYFDLFSKTYIGTLDLNNTINSTSINIYCSTIMLPLVYLYLLNKDIDKKERKLTFIIILLLVIPCFIGTLNYLWHLFTIPSFYSYRFSYLLCFFMIVTAYKSITNLKLSLKKILIYLTFYSLITIYFIIITTLSKYYPFLNYKLILLTFMFLAIYLILMFKLKNNKILSFLIIIELVINIFIIFSNSKLNSLELLTNLHLFQNKINDYRTQNRIEITDEINEDIFKGYISNNSLTMNNRTTGTFLSTNNINNIKQSIHIGMNEKIEKDNSYVSLYHSKIYNSLFGVEYTYSSQIDYDYSLIDKIKFKEEYKIYKNNDYLNIGYIVKDKCNNLEFSFPYDELVLNCLTKTNNHFYKEYKLKKKNNNILEYSIKNKGYYYLYMNNINDYIEHIEMIEPVEVVFKSYDFVILQNHQEDFNLKIKIGDEINSDNIKIYYLDYKNVVNEINKLKKEQLEYKIESNKLKGTIKTTGGTLLLTIPYENGFKIKVDSKSTNYEKVLDSFIGIELTEGEHEIIVEYEQPGLKFGIIVSGLSIITIMIFLKKGEKCEVNKKK